jgi:hypothetical protein
VFPLALPPTVPEVPPEDESVPGTVRFTFAEAPEGVVSVPVEALKDGSTYITKSTISTRATMRPTIIPTGESSVVTGRVSEGLLMIVAIVIFVILLIPI